MTASTAGHRLAIDARELAKTYKGGVEAVRALAERYARATPDR